MKAMTVFLPDDIEGHEGDIRFFLDSMIRKLSANSHKGWVSKHDVAKMCGLMDGECAEFMTALAAEGQFEAFMEAVDIANMALLSGIAVSKQTREEFDQCKPHS